MLRWVLGGAASVIVGCYFLFRFYVGVPALEQLTTVTGDVASAEIEFRRTRRMQSKFLSVRIGDKPAAFYQERFPDFERIATSIQPGDRVTAWVDVGKDNYIWQLEKGGERLVSYEQVAEAQHSNNRNNALLGVLFLVFGVGTLVVMLYQWTKGAPASAAAQA